MRARRSARAQRSSNCSRMEPLPPKNHSHHGLVAHLIVASEHDDGLTVARVLCTPHRDDVTLGGPGLDHPSPLTRSRKSPSRLLRHADLLPRRSRPRKQEPAERKICPSSEQLRPAQARDGLRRFFSRPTSSSSLGLVKLRRDGPARSRVRRSACTLEGGARPTASPILCPSALSRADRGGQQGSSRSSRSRTHQLSGCPLRLTLRGSGTLTSASGSNRRSGLLRDGVKRNEKTATRAAPGPSMRSRKKLNLPRPIRPATTSTWRVSRFRPPAHESQRSITPTYIGFKKIHGRRRSSGRRTARRAAPVHRVRSRSTMYVPPREAGVKPSPPCPRHGRSA